MGLLSVFGKPLPYAAAKQYFQYLRTHAVQQFINLHAIHKSSNVPIRNLKFGYESEYHVINQADHKIVSNAILLKDFINNYPNAPFQVLPEYGGWMWELIPKNPFSLSAQGLVDSANHITHSVDFCKKYLSLQLMDICSMSSYPLLGVGKYFINENPDLLDNPYSQSSFSNDTCITPHPRFPALTENIKLRRGKKVNISIPAFIDKNTDFSSIHMDSMQFGMGCCCLQATYDAANLSQCLSLSDSLHALSPIIASLSGSSAIFRGLLSDIDLRWTVISQSVDDRTENERNKLSPQYISKSRFSEMNHYLSTDDKYLNDQNYSVDNSIVDKLINSGVEKQLAFHVSSLLLRDPLVIFDQAIQLDDTKRSAHFENFQSTNWNSIRFKPPPSMDSKIGWRVEFRTPDLQITPVENGAMLVLMGLLVNVIRNYNVDFKIPISKCDVNMNRAHFRNSATGQKFFFRNNILSKQKEPEEYTLKEILVGKNGIGGLYALIFKYLEDEKTNAQLMREIIKYLAINLGKSDGRLPTGASVIREFVGDHNKYKHDSRISEDVAVDLMKYLQQYDITANRNYDVCVKDVANMVGHNYI